MGLFKPKVPKPPAAPNTAIAASDDSTMSQPLMPAAESLINTSSQGLKRRATTQRGSLIGGG